MKSKILITLTLFTVFLLLVEGCIKVPYLYNKAPDLLTDIYGTAYFPTHKESVFSTKSSLAKISTNTTVSLLYPSDHTDFTTKTIATGFTDVKDPFRILSKKAPLEMSGDLENFINTISIPNTGNGNDFIQPAFADLSVWNQVINLINEGRYEETSFIADGQNYDAINFTHSDNKTYFVLRERVNGFRGLGTYVFNPDPLRDMVLEVPHPINDLNTREQGIKAFIQLQPMALLIAGTYRCSNCQASHFEGTTTVCNSSCSLPAGSNPYRVSDVAHYKFNFFHETHESLYDLNPKFYYIQLHGASDGSLGLDPDDVQVDAILTLGTGETSPVDSKILALDQALDNAGRNSRIFGTDTAKLGGATNLQGRYTNGRSVETCTTPCTANGFFIHIEQDSTLRSSPQTMIDAISTAFPVN